MVLMSSTSLGGGGYSQAMADAVAYASRNGSVVVIAAGNSEVARQTIQPPAINHGLAVGAVNQQKTMASFSNRAGSTVLDYVTAPGVDVYPRFQAGDTVISAEHQWPHRTLQELPVC